MQLLVFYSAWRTCRYLSVTPLSPFFGGRMLTLHHVARFSGVAGIEALPVLMLRPRAWNMPEDNLVVSSVLPLTSYPVVITSLVLFSVFKLSGRWQECAGISVRLCDVDVSQCKVSECGAVGTFFLSL